MAFLWLINGDYQPLVNWDDPTSSSPQVFPIYYTWIFDPQLLAIDPNISIVATQYPLLPRETTEITWSCNFKQHILANACCNFPVISDSLSI